MTPNVHHSIGALVVLELPCGARAVVDAERYAACRLQGFRWYVGPRGLVVASVGPWRTTVYLSRLLAGARAAQRVSLKERGARSLPGVPYAALDYRKSNLRVIEVRRST